MLVLTRRVNERIVIGDGIVVTVLEIKGDQIRLGIAAPRHVQVHREELLRALAESNVAALLPERPAALPQPPAHPAHTGSRPDRRRSRPRRAGVA